MLKSGYVMKKTPMKIEDLDKNFKSEGKLECENIRYNVKNPPFEIYGVYYDEQKGFMRMPEEVARGNINLSHPANDSTGGRIKFSTDSDVFELRVQYKRFFDMAHMPRTGQTGFVLIDETDGEYNHIQTFRVNCGEESGFDKWALSPTADCKVSLCSSCKLKGDKMRQYVLFMPLYGGVQSVEIALAPTAKVASGKPYKKDKTVLYYGSSITQGGCASRPDNCYQGFISKWTNTDYVDLGFSGAAKGEKHVAEHLATIDCNVFVCDYDHNEYNVEDLRAKHYAFYKTYRSNRPNTPILFVSRPDADRAERLEERLKVIKDTVKQAKKEGDKNVYFLSGVNFFGKTKSERECCTVDGCHPNDLGFYKMAKKIKGALAKIDKVYE